MKTLVVLCLMVGVAISKSFPRESPPIVDYIRHYGYPVETYHVNAPDGYILQIFRIPNGLKKQHQDSNRPAVLLMHGYLSSAEDFVYGGPSQGLSFYLADHGYDVYLGNLRGSTYGQNHTSLDPSKDAAFWSFSFHESGTIDLPAIVDKVVEISQQDKISYIGHEEGATVFYIMASELPRYNTKVESAVSLGPVVFLKSSSCPLLATIAENYRSKSWVIKNVGHNTFQPSNQLVENLQQQCSNANRKREICQDVYFLLKGYNSDNFNQSIAQRAFSRVPFGGSVWQALHLAQWKVSGHFESFGGTSGDKAGVHQYQLSQVSIPVSIFYTNSDPLSTTQDVQYLIGQLPNVYHEQVVEKYTNNLDLIYGNNVVDFYEDVEKVIGPHHRESQHYQQSMENDDFL